MASGEAVRAQLDAALKDAELSREQFMRVVRIYGPANPEEIKLRLKVTYQGEKIEIFGDQTIKKIYNGNYGSDTVSSREKIRKTLWFARNVAGVLHKGGNSTIVVSGRDYEKCLKTRQALEELDKDSSPIVTPVAHVPSGMRLFAGKSFAYALTMDGVGEGRDLQGKSVKGVVGYFSLSADVRVHVEDAHAFFVMEDGSLVENAEWHSLRNVFFDADKGFITRFMLTPVEIRNGKRHKLNDKSFRGLFDLHTANPTEMGTAFSGCEQVLRGEITDMVPSRVEASGEVYCEMFSADTDVEDALEKHALALLERV